MKRLLILGGTYDAVAMAKDIVHHIDPTCIVYSLAGCTEQPEWPDHIERRSGGFGGARGIADYLRQAGIALCLDATHPFAHQISQNAKTACGQCNIPYVRLQRQRWRMMENDQWRYFDCTLDLIAALDATHNRVLFTLGQRHLGVFSALQRTQGVFRMIHPSPDAAALTATNRHQILCLRPPYSFDTEMKIIDQYHISCLVTRASGGRRPAKLDVCGERRLPVWILNDLPTDTVTAQGGETTSEESDDNLLSASDIAQMYIQQCL